MSEEKSAKNSNKMKYVYCGIVLLSIVSIVAIHNFLYPSDQIYTDSKNYGNFTVTYVMSDMDDGGVGIMRDSDRLKLDLTIKNNYSDNVTLSYSDFVQQINPVLTPQLPPWIDIQKEHDYNTTRIFTLHAGVNAIYSNIELYTSRTEYKGGPLLSPIKLQSVQIEYPTIRAITQSEFDNRFVYTTTAILAVATIVLVLVTTYYAKQTKNTVDVLRETSNLSIRPYLKGTFQSIGPVAGDLVIKNVGNGPAHKIELSYWIESKDDDTKRNWRKPLLMPNDGEEFFIPKNKTESVFDNTYFENNQTTIRINGKYYDILGNEFPIDDTLDVTAYVKQWNITKIRYKETPQEEISKSIEGISKSIDDCGREISKLGNKIEKKQDKNNSKDQL